MCLADLLHTDRVCYAGYDSADYLRKYAGRSPVVHLKDFTCSNLNMGPVYALIDLDDVYWKLNSKQKAIIEYRTLGRKMELVASDDFSYMVVFTPRDRPCFCLENQTCSTDAHNLYAAGLKEISGLILLPPGDVHEGWIRFTPGTL